jgi:RHS repeat-associated protein
VGNRLTRVDTTGGETDYTYDANDRLLSETTGGATTQYGYDANGNTLSKFTSAVDQALYQWDAQNRLVGASVTDSTGTQHIAYQYDADGIRVSSKVDSDVTRYLIDTVQPYAQVLEEYTPGGVIKVSYVYGNDLISQDRAGAKSFYAVDGLGSTRALTNASGVVTDRYFYDAFGRTIGQTGSTVNLYLFAGEQRDSNVGLDYLRARYLSVSNGRFYSMDNAEIIMGNPMTLDRFIYTNDTPVIGTDPSGHFTLEDAMATIAIAALVIALEPATAFAPSIRVVDITANFPDQLRNDPGTMTVVIDGGRERYQFPALGRGSSPFSRGKGVSTAHPWWQADGDTPTGRYTGEYFRSVPHNNIRSYGPNGWIVLTPQDVGDHAWLASYIFGRSGIGIHGGRDETNGNGVPRTLRPTYGCIRISDSDMKRLSGDVKTAKEISVNVTGPQPEAPLQIYY